MGGGEPTTAEAAVTTATTGSTATTASGGSASRQRLVDAAVELILDHHRGRSDPRDVYAFLTPRAVAERAGLSRGLIYHHWGEADAQGGDAFGAFLDTVADELWERVAIPEGLADLAELLPDNLSDVLVTLADYELDRLAGVESDLARAILVLSVYGIGRPEGAMVDSVRRLADLYERLLAKLDLEVVPPLTPTDLAVSIMCLLDGFTINLPSMAEFVDRRHQWTPRVPPEQSADVSWSLFAIGVESLTLNMTRPRSGAPAATDSVLRGGGVV